MATGVVSQEKADINNVIIFFDQQPRSSTQESIYC